MSSGVVFCVTGLVVLFVPMQNNAIILSSTPVQGEYFQRQSNPIKYLFFWGFFTLKMTLLRSLETSGTPHPPIYSYIPDGLNPEQRCGVNLKFPVPAVYFMTLLVTLPERRW